MKSKILIPLLIVLSIILGSMQIASAETENVTLRIEGINENIYYGSVDIGDLKTVADIIIAAADRSDDLSVIGAESGYITDINGQTAAAFGGWDGWMYRVNDTEPSVSMNEYNIRSGDEIVVFYSDAYGVGMQYPFIKEFNAEGGMMTFMSIDVSYDENFNAVTSENPVVDMTVIFDETEYKTDENGRITVDKALLTSGDHKIAVSKYSEDGIPLVLRLSPGKTVNVPASTIDEGKTPQTGDNINMAVLIAVAVVSLLGCGIAAKARK